MKELTDRDGAGTFFEATPTITEDGKINVQYKLVIQKVMEKRVPIEGAEGLNIDYPLIASRSTSSNAVLNEGQSMVLMSEPQGGGQCFLVILTAKSK